MAKKNKNDLSVFIEEYALEHAMDLSDAILEILETKDVDEKYIAENINDQLKQKLELEYRAKRMLRR
jgi:hypothetical protein